MKKNGPYQVSGAVPLGKEIIEVDGDGYPIKWKKGENYSRQENYRLCRCGRSKHMPYCDMAHLEVSFDGTETASRKKYLEQAQIFVGPGLDLADAQALCAEARFCDRAGGTWELTRNSADSKAKKLAIEQACNCPSGRLVAWDKKNKAIEPQLEPSISLVEDPAANASGPIWVKGGIEIESADGEKYETRNRVTLCRCGKSQNKPFCDGVHLKIEFNDGDPSLKQ